MLRGPAPALLPHLPPVLPCALPPGSELAQCLTRSIQQSYHAAQVQGLAQARDLLMSADPRAEPVVVGQPLPLDADFLTRARDNKAQVVGGGGGLMACGMQPPDDHVTRDQCDVETVCIPWGLGLIVVLLFVHVDSCQAASALIISTFWT